MHKESIDITLTEVGGGESVGADWRGSCVVAQVGQTAAVPGAETGLRVCGQAMRVLDARQPMFSATDA